LAIVFLKTGSFQDNYLKVEHLRTRFVKDIRVALPIILCTGYSDRIDEGKAIDPAIK